MNIVTLIFVLISYTSNFLTSKLFFKKIIIKGKIAAFFSILTYSIFGSIGALISRKIISVSFRVISLFFLLKVLSIVLFLNKKSFILFFISNATRAFIAAFLNYFCLALMKSSIKGVSKKEIVTISFYILTIIISFLFAFFISSRLYESIIFTINIVAFIFFFILGSFTSQKNYSVSGWYTKQSFIKSIAIRTINTIIISYTNSGNIIFLFIRILKIILLFLKLVLFFALIFSYHFICSNHIGKSTLFFFLATCCYKIASLMHSKLFAILTNKMLKISICFFQNENFSLKNVIAILFKSNPSSHESGTIINTISKYIVF